MKMNKACNTTTVTIVNFNYNLRIGTGLLTENITEDQILGTNSSFTPKM